MREHSREAAVYMTNSVCVIFASFQPEVSEYRVLEPSRKVAILRLFGFFRVISKACVCARGMHLALSVNAERARKITFAQAHPNPEEPDHYLAILAWTGDYKPFKCYLN